MSGFLMALLGLGLFVGVWAIANRVGGLAGLVDHHLASLDGRIAHLSQTLEEQASQILDSEAAKTEASDLPREPDFPISVHRMFSIRDGHLLGHDASPLHRVGFTETTNMLFNRAPREVGGGPAWEIAIWVGTGPSARQVLVPLQRFLTSDEYQDSTVAPFSFNKLPHQLTDDPKKEKEKRDQDLVSRHWLYRDTIYATQRPPRPSEVEEVVLHIKALHFQRSRELEALKEQVAAIEDEDV